MTMVKDLEIPGGRRLLLVEGDLLQQPVDAIVNAANGMLAHGGGVAAVIARSAGSELDDDGKQLVARHGPIPTGEAVVTVAGALPFEGVIHAVGPRLGEGEEERLLTEAIGNALLRAHERDWSSVAFPAVSSGIFSVPLDVCARAYVAGIREHLDWHPDSSLREIRCCLLPGPLIDQVAAEMDRVFGVEPADV